MGLATEITYFTEHELDMVSLFLNLRKLITLSTIIQSLTQRIEVIQTLRIFLHWSLCESFDKMFRTERVNGF
jgi:hypothetical protein